MLSFLSRKNYIYYSATINYFYGGDIMNKYENIVKTMEEKLQELKDMCHREYDNVPEDIGIYSDLDKASKRLLNDTILGYEAGLAIMRRIKTDEDEQAYEDVLRPLTNLTTRQIQQYELLVKAYEKEMAARREKELQGYKKELTMEDIRRSKRYF